MKAKVLAWSVTFVVALSFSLVALVRTDSDVRKGATILFLQLETEYDIPLRPLKELCGIKMSLTNQALLEAASQGKSEELALLLAAGGDSNLVDRDGSSLLHLAVQGGHLYAVQTIIGNGANINSTDSDQSTPLHLALRNESAQVALQLLRLGAEPNTIDSSGESPLTTAVRSGNFVLTESLLQSGANTNQFITGKNGPLSVARELGNARLVDLLLKYGANSGSSHEKEKGVATKGNSKVSQFTRLRVVGKPVGVWERGENLTLKEIRVSVRNVGEVDSNDVIVKAILPGGERVRLAGPKMLGRNEVAEYAAKDISKKIYEGGEIGTEVVCANCRTRD